MSKLNVLLDTSPLKNANSVRGVGMYTRMLQQELEKLPNISLLPTSQKAQADVVHYPFFDLFFDTLPLLNTKPVVVTIHDVIPLIFPKQYQPGLKGRARFQKQKLALRSVKKVITDSMASKRDIQTFLNVPEEKIKVVSLAGNPEIGSVGTKTQERILTRYSLPDQYILYVGDINYNKNIPKLIKTLKYLDDSIHLVCVGKNFKPAPIEEWQWIETQIAMSDVANRVHFVTDLGSDANQDLSALYSAAQVYVQPSLYEGFGLPVLEAMQAKTPVVVTPNSSLLEVAGQAAVFAQSTEARDLATGVQEVLDWTKAQRTRLVKTAFDWSQLFTWQKTAAETAKIYQEIVS